MRIIRDSKKINSLQNMPEYYHEVSQIVELSKSLTLEFQKICDENFQDLNDMFVLNANEQAITIWEKEIYIRHNAKQDLAEFRRKRIINRYTTKPPFTIRWLEKQVRELIGENFCVVSRDSSVQTLFVHADISSYKLLKEFITTLEITLPLNMLYQLVLQAKREPKTKIYYGAAAIVHLHLVCGV